MRYSTASALPSLLSRASDMTSKSDLIKLIGLALSDSTAERAPRKPAITTPRVSDNDEKESGE